MSVGTVKRLMVPTQSEIGKHIPAEMQKSPVQRLLIRWNQRHRNLFVTEHHRVPSFCTRSVYAVLYLKSCTGLIYLSDIAISRSELLMV
jgi:hypothetical protein